MNTIIVDDDEYTKLSESYGRLGNKIEEELATYCSILDTVTTSGIKSGDVHQNFLTFQQKVCMLRNQLSPLLAEMAKTSTDYDNDIDVADGSLY